MFTFTRPVTVVGSINNLVASAVWHKLACMEPPRSLTHKLQAILVDLFWDQLHWVLQKCAVFNKRGRGTGSGPLDSRVATFRFQFIQKYLTGSTDVAWRDVTSCLLRKASGLG